MVDKRKFQEALIIMVKDVVDSFLNNVNFNTIEKGIVKKIDGNSATVSINDNIYSCLLLQNTTVSIGDVVIVSISNKNKIDKIILGKI